MFLEFRRNIFHNMQACVHISNQIQMQSLNESQLKKKKKEKLMTKLLAIMENNFSVIIPTPKLMTCKITPLRNTATLNLCHCIINPFKSVLFNEMFHLVIRSGANISCLSDVTKREMTND